MKSQFYREVSYDSRTRKSTTNQKQKKQSQNSTHINPIILSKDFKSQKRGLIHSIDLIKKSKRQNDHRAMRISYSKPLISVQNTVDEMPILEKSIISVCLRCESLISQNEKNIKSLKMRYQQELTEQTQRYINMEKKFLMKENEYIKLFGQFNQVSMSNKQLKQKISVYEPKLQQLIYKCKSYDQQIIRLQGQLKKCQQTNKMFSHFLTLFAEQTKCMLNWAHLFQSSYQELPELVRIIKQDLSVRKLDLEIMLKQSMIFKKDHFGNDPNKQISNQCSFFGSEQDSSESFMKYLKQETATSKIKAFKIPMFSQIKGRSYDNESFMTNKENIDIVNKENTFSTNKENIDTTNRPIFKSLIQSRMNVQLQKIKSQNLKDQYFRMLLLQAQTIQLTTESLISRAGNASTIDAIQSISVSTSKKGYIQYQ